MGRGDKKSRRGKIFAGSFGKTRMKTKKKFYPAVAVEVVAPVKAKKTKKVKEESAQP